MREYLRRPGDVEDGAVVVGSFVQNPEEKARDSSREPRDATECSRQLLHLCRCFALLIVVSRNRCKNTSPPMVKVATCLALNSFPAEHFADNIFGYLKQPVKET